MKQLQEILEDEQIIENSAMEVQEIVEDGKKVLHPDNKTAVLLSTHITNNNVLDHKCLDKVVKKLNAHPIR